MGLKSLDSYLEEFRSMLRERLREAERRLREASEELIREAEKSLKEEAERLRRALGGA